MTRETYGMPHLAPGSGAVVTDVVSGSEADIAGVFVGDRVLAVDGAPVRDVLEWQWLTAESDFVLTLERAHARLQIEVEHTVGRPFGVSFADLLFDGVRECDNSCTFCFVAQLPRGLRASLYVRDDDFRLSFLSGTFVTLTNLTDDDIARIAEQRLSPLYVSLHAVDPAVRARLMCPTVEDRALERFDELLAENIRLHAQIVLVPGINDKEALDETIEWLAERPGVLSVGIVPLGHTGHQSRFTRSFEDPASARTVLKQVTERQEELTVRGRRAWLQAADEFYLNAGLDVPTADAYGDFPQYENGVGLVRTFLDDLVEETAGRQAARDVVAVTGTLFAPVLTRVLAGVGLAGAVDVLAVPNRLLGGGVSVTGLMGGAEIIDAIRSYDGEGPFLVPDVVVNSDGLLLDDTPAGSLPAMTGKDVRIVSTDAMGLVAVVCD
ncbi:MAG: DUF512 domain-containing protein [Coriobacteriia bacterium]|nr:DUF512 domain-containing protein [Coriobacteriia bacterium]